MHHTFFVRWARVVGLISLGLCLLWPAFAEEIPITLPEVSCQEALRPWQQAHEALSQRNAFLTGVSWVLAILLAGSVWVMRRQRSEQARLEGMLREQLRLKDRLIAELQSASGSTGSVFGKKMEEDE